MTTDEALLHASNRAAHKVARAAAKWRRKSKQAIEAGVLDYLTDKEQRDWSAELRVPVERALDEYEEVERQASEAREATA